MSQTTALTCSHLWLGCAWDWWNCSYLTWRCGLCTAWWDGTGEPVERRDCTGKDGK